MASAAAEAEKGSPVVVGLLVVGNIIILLSGLALFAETVWVTADQYRVYPLMGVSGKDDVFAGAWIAIFCGFSFFVVASFGVGAALCRRRSMILTYLVLMLIVYIFECASCITSYTHRDYMVSNPSLITKQMLTFYSADTDQGRELTRLWDRIMIEQECCGTSGPMDWVNFTSAFRAATPEVVLPWPPLCCRRTGNFIPLNEEGCRLGHTDYLFTKGCFEHISHAIDSYTWGISWFGFAILMWTVRAACDADGHVFLHHVVRDRKATYTPRPLPPPVPVSSGRGLDGCLSSPLPTSLKLPSFLTKDLFPGF
ncbi:uroplakin-1a isoform X1 [Leopardus geoffroyi]|uniref:uroplakin-1a isoform X1 n=1 Tax=Leopardus geoffroyi TaxID=46844 RepID=UPI001E25EC58|nr:uroplakin-1a isoform X1 [Leopardus geoffroyi]